MAVVTTKAAAITNRDATPVVLNNASVAGSVLREAVGFVESVSGDSIGSKYIICSLPSNARVSQVLLYSDDIGTTTTADCGIYRTTADGSAVVDADFFASAVVLNAGAVNGTDITHEADAGDSGVGFGYADVEKPLWQCLQLTSDPGVLYDVVLTLTAASDGAGTVGLKVRYVI